MTTLSDIYARVPDVRCKGLCHEACGLIPCSKGEADAMEAASGRGLTYSADHRCGYLVNGRCSVYEHRPLICRLFGAVTNPLMRCPHGCKPERALTDMEAHALLKQVKSVAGETVLAERDQ